MSQITVNAVTGRKSGSAASRRLRAQGKLPGVVYGLDKDPIAVAVDYAELRDALKGAHGMNTIFSIDIDGSQNDTVMVRQVQRDSVKRVVTHADFLRIDPSKPVKVTVPVHIVGDETGVTNEGGMIEQKIFRLEVEALPLQVPAEIQADVTIMRLDRSLSVSDLNLPEGVTSMVAEDVSVVAPVIPRVVEVAAPVPEADIDGESEVEGESGDGEGDSASDGESSGGGDKSE